MAFCDLKLYCWDLSSDMAESIPVSSAQVQADICSHRCRLILDVITTGCRCIHSSWYCATPGH
eukprot:3941018-Rhodomonas_salina.7